MRRAAIVLALSFLSVHAFAQTVNVPFTFTGTIAVPTVQGPPGPQGPAGASGGSGGPSSPGCRLSLSSGHPVILSDAVSGILYCVPFKPGIVTTQLSVSLAGVAGGAIRDVYLNGSALCLSTWQGAACGSIFLGSVLTDPVGGQASCTISYGQYRSCGVWNSDPAMQIDIVLQAGDTSAPDNACGTGPRNCYVPAQSLGPARGNPGNSLEVFLGRAEQIIDVRYKQVFFINTSAGAAAYFFGVGRDSTTSTCGLVAVNNIDVPVPGNAVGNTMEAECIVPPYAGVATFYMLEQGRGNAQAFRNSPNQLLIVRYRG